MEVFIRVIGKMEEDMGKEFIHQKIKINILVIGKIMIHGY